jgi:hypothetical protein
LLAKSRSTERDGEDPSAQKRISLRNPWDFDSQTDSQQDNQRHISVHDGKLVMSQNSEIFDIRGYQEMLIHGQPGDS